MKLFNENAAISHSITIQDEPVPHTDVLGRPIYFDGTYDPIVKSFIPLTIFLAKDTHSPGDQKIYLVQADRIPDRYVYRLVSEQALSNYHFNTKNIRSIDMNIQNGNPKYSHAGPDLLE